MLKGIIAVAIVATAISGAHSARAQDIDGALQSLDNLYDRLDAKPSTRPTPDRPPPGPGEPFLEQVVDKPAKPSSLSFKFTAGAIRDSNAKNAETGEKSAWKTAPAVQLAWSYAEAGKASWTVALSAQHESYSRFSRERDSALAALQVKHVTAPFAGDYKAYIEYKAADVRTKLWDEHIITTHDVTGGLQRAFDKPFGGALPGKLDVDAAVMRRNASIASKDETRMRLRLTYTHPLNRSKAFKKVVVGQIIEQRNFDDTGAVGRRDSYFKTSIGVSEWKIGKILFGADITYERLDSNVAGASYKNWDIGPNLTFHRPF